MTEAELINEGYTIKNAKITSVDLSMRDYGCLTLNIGLDGMGWSCNYGGICIGHGYLGAEKFDSSPKAAEYLMRIMDTVGVEKLSDLKGKIVRVALDGWGEPVNIIGNVLDDKWFNQRAFFSDVEDAL